MRIEDPRAYLVPDEKVRKIFEEPKQEKEPVGDVWQNTVSKGKKSLNLKELDGFVVAQKDSGHKLERFSLKVSSQLGFDMVFDFADGVKKVFGVWPDNFKPKNKHLSGRDVVKEFLSRAFEGTKFGADEKNIENLLKSAEENLKYDREKMAVYKEVLRTSTAVSYGDSRTNSKKMCADTKETKRYLAAYDGKKIQGKKTQGSIMFTDIIYNGSWNFPGRK